MLRFLWGRRGSLEDIQREDREMAIEFIEKYTSRLSSSSFMEDRRSAMLFLKSYVEKYPMEVGNISMQGIISSIKNQNLEEVLSYSEDEAMEHPTSELVIFGIEILIHICDYSISSSDVDSEHSRPEKTGSIFTEILLKDPSNIEMVLKLLEGKHFFLKYYSIHLLKKMLENGQDKARRLVVTNQGISPILTLLDSRKDVLRNEGLLLMKLLLKKNTDTPELQTDIPLKDILIRLNEEDIDIPKIIVFENGFEKILRILKSELEEEDKDNTHSAIIKDCLELLYLLLNGNESTQLYFSETNLLYGLIESFVIKLHRYEELIQIFSLFPKSSLFNRVDFAARVPQGFLDSLCTDHWRQVVLDFLSKICRHNEKIAMLVLNQAMPGGRTLISWLFERSLSVDLYDTWGALCSSLISTYIEIFDLGPDNVQLLEKIVMEGPQVKSDLQRFVYSCLYISQYCTKHPSYAQALTTQETTEGDLFLDFLFQLFGHISMRYDFSQEQMKLIQRHLLYLFYALTLHIDTSSTSPAIWYERSVYFQYLLESLRYIDKVSKSLNENRPDLLCPQLCLVLIIIENLVSHAVDSDNGTQINTGQKNEGQDKILTKKKIIELLKPFSVYQKNNQLELYKLFDFPKFIQESVSESSAQESTGQGKMHLAQREASNKSIVNADNLMGSQKPIPANVTNYPSKVLMSELRPERSNPIVTDELGHTSTLPSLNGPSRSVLNHPLDTLDMTALPPLPESPLNPTRTAPLSKSPLLNISCESVNLSSQNLSENMSKDHFPSIIEPSKATDLDEHSSLLEVPLTDDPLPTDPYVSDGRSDVTLGQSTMLGQFATKVAQFLAPLPTQQVNTSQVHGKTTSLNKDRQNIPVSLSSVQDSHSIQANALDHPNLSIDRPHRDHHMDQALPIITNTAASSSLQNEVPRADGQNSEETNAILKGGCYYPKLSPIIAGPLIQSDNIPDHLDDYTGNIKHHETFVGNLNSASLSNLQNIPSGNPPTIPLNIETTIVPSNAGTRANMPTQLINNDSVSTHTKTSFYNPPVPVDQCYPTNVSHGALHESQGAVSKSPITNSPIFRSPTLGSQSNNNTNRRPARVYHTDLYGTSHSATASILYPPPIPNNQWNTYPSIDPQNISVHSSRPHTLSPQMHIQAPQEQTYSIPPTAGFNVLPQIPPPSYNSMPSAQPYAFQ